MWKSLVPVAFHVDYWNYLGWEDRFSRPEFSNRQGRYERAGAVSTVYTPGFVVNGREWRNSLGAPPRNSNADPGILSAVFRPRHVEIEFQPRRPLSEEILTANIALLGFGLATNIRAGENKGLTLTHDFVVLDLKQNSMRADRGIFTATARRPSIDADAQRYAIALWVTRAGQQTPLQAAGRWLEAEQRESQPN